MIIGIDEVGRGAWAGPMVFCAVSLPDSYSFSQKLSDSKLLSSKKIELLAEEIKQICNPFISINISDYDDLPMTIHPIMGNTN